MLTQCPNCETTFRVTSEILRVADGQVRCGRCHTQFDALQRLIEDEPAQETRFARQRAAPSEAEEQASHEEITLEGKHIEITGTYLVVDESAHDGQPQIRQEVVEEWVEIEDEDVQAALAGESAEEIVIADAIDAGAEQTPPEPIAAEAAKEEEIEATSEPETEPETDATPDMDLFAPKPRRRTAWIWKVLALPLLLLLVAQVIHHYRAELARHPRLGQLVTDAYDAVGLRLTPDWNLHAYEIQHWAVVPDVATGTLNLRASITNRAPYPQPYPLLRLVLEDRWGDIVRAREFEPAEYLDPGTAPDRLLAPAQRANVAIAIVDPGAEAAGFRFEACLRGRNGVVCSSEVPE